MSRLLPGLLLAMLTLTACSPGSDYSGAVGPSGDAAAGSVSRETRIACRDRVNEMYDRRNRVDIYAPNSSMNTPYSSNYQSGISSRGLASQFDYERTRIDCETNSGTGTGRTEAPTAAPRFRQR